MTKINILMKPIFLMISMTMFLTTLATAGSLEDLLKKALEDKAQKSLEDKAKDLGLDLNELESSKAEPLNFSGKAEEETFLAVANNGTSTSPSSPPYGGVIIVDPLIKNYPKSGLYTIRQKSNNQYLDAHTYDKKDYSVVTRPYQGDNTQKWYLHKLSGNTYTLKQHSSRRFVDAHDTADKDYNVVTRGAQNNDTQKWILNYVSNNVYTIKQKHSGRYLDAHDIASRDFSAVTRPRQNNKTQQWLIQATKAKIKRRPPPPRNRTPSNTNNYREIRTIKGRCLDIAGGVNKSGTNIQIYQCNKSKSQKWSWTSKKEIKNVMGLCLDVTKSRKANGTNVQLYKCNGSKAQQWYWRHATKTIYSALGSCLDVTRGRNANGVNVQIYKCKKSSAQKWNKK